MGVSFLLTLLLLARVISAAPVEVTLSITASELAVVINAEDPQSVAVGAAYAAQRGVPHAQVVTLSFPVAQNLPRAAFAPLKAQLDAALPKSVQALVLTWLWPFKVDCMSVTSAFAFGFNTSFCGQCTPTAPSPLYNATSSAPYSDFGMRPAFLLAGWSTQSALRTLAAGIASDGTHPRGDGFAFRTFDVARSVRFQEFEAATAEMAGKFNQTYEDCRAPNCSDWGYLVNRTNVLTYWQSIAVVANLSSNTFLPGAVGDHLTSYGGILTNSSGQMPCIEYLEAGATASFGTVVEPCNYCQKFPDPSIFWPFYYAGASLVEAYWKSVAWPGEGLFVGEPLARPFGATIAGVAAALAAAEGEGLRVQLDRSLPLGEYAVRVCAGARHAGVLGCGERSASLVVDESAAAATEFLILGADLAAGAAAADARVLLQRVRVPAVARGLPRGTADPDGCPPSIAAAVPLSLS